MNRKHSCRQDIKMNLEKKNRTWRQWPTKKIKKCALRPTHSLQDCEQSCTDLYDWLHWKCHAWALFQVLSQNKGAKQ